MKLYLTIALFVSIILLCYVCLGFELTLLTLLIVNCFINLMR